MKYDIYELIIIDKNLLQSKNHKIDEKIELLLVASQQYLKEIIFDI